MPRVEDEIIIDIPYGNSRTVSVYINDTLSERLNRIPNSQEVRDMIEGERYKVAKKIALKIGSLLDKALYLKFKQKPKK